MMPHVGHVIETDVHENPMFHPYDDTILAPGMVFMLEPGFQTEEGFYHTEDMVAVTEDGYLEITAAPTEPIIIT